jgi:hypothetical protein
MPDNVAGWQVLGPPGCAGILAGSFWALGNFMVSAHRCSPASCGLDGPPPLAALWNVVMKLDVCLGCQNADYDGGLAGGQRGGPGAVAQRHDHHIGPARHFLVPPPEHNYHDRKSGLTEIYLRCVRPILIVNLMQVQRRWKSGLQAPVVCGGVMDPCGNGAARAREGDG